MQKKPRKGVRESASRVTRTIQGNSSRPAFSPPAIKGTGPSLALPQLHFLLVISPDKSMSNMYCLYRKYSLENGDDGDGDGDGDGPL